MKYRIWEDDYGVLDVEVHQRQAFIHCEVKRWSRASVRHMDRVFVAVTECLWLGGAREAFALSPDEKAFKFARMFGFKRTGIAHDGRIISTYRIPAPMQVRQGESNG